MMDFKLKTKQFARWARSEGLTDEVLLAVIDDMDAGRTGVIYGAGLYKIRVALPGRGKSGSTRVVIATNLGGRWLFVDGYAKNVCANIKPLLVRRYKRLSKGFLAMPDVEIISRIAMGKYERIDALW